MALPSVLDLSDVTDALTALIQDAVGANYGVTGLPPDAIRKDSAQLSLYLFHITKDKFQQNSPVVSQQVPLPAPGQTIRRAQRIPAQPLSLDLYYLLTAYIPDSYAHEQQVMTLALKCLHEHPIVRLPLGSATTTAEFSVTMEPESVDDLGRLWQAITSSLRLSVVYKVSVVFITPQQAPEPATQVQMYSIAANPTVLPPASGGQVMGTLRSYRYTGPGDATPLQRSLDLSPATAGPGERLLLLGIGIDQPTCAQVFLLAPGGEYDITTWIAPPVAYPNPPPPTVPLRTERKITLQLPPAAGPLPAPAGVPTQTPPAGVYQLRVGTGTVPGDPGYYRSNTTPFNVAAFVDPTPPVILAPSAGVFTIAGMGFIAGQTEVLLETISLASGAVSAGSFAVISASEIRFMAPADLAHGTYAVRVRVNTIECVPAKWIQV
jgi:hypothetical protein